jgi:C_GCAxxG_C_C family probable redox protein
MASLEMTIDKSISEYMQGAHCAEVIFTNVSGAWQPGFDRQLMRLANPFGGGIADCGDVCGALIGGLMVIGYFFGRRSLDQSQDYCWKLSKRYHDAFKHDLCATTCYEIRGKIFDWDSHVKCSNTVKKAIGILWGLLEEAGKQGKLER